MPKTRPFLLVLFSTTIFTDVARAELPEFPMTLADMEVLAGYYTADGKYLGGIPKAHTLSREIYECSDFQYSEPNNTASNATYCTGWSADESYGGGFQLGDCECKFGASNGAYCSDWICNQGKECEYWLGSDGYVTARTCLDESNIWSRRKPTPSQLIGLCQWSVRYSLLGDGGAGVDTSDITLG